MYFLKGGIKKNPVRRWALPDRIFFGYGACHILAGVYLRNPPLDGFHAERIIPDEDRAGAHVYVTNGEIAFDYHGYSLRSRLLAHHGKVWRTRYKDWSYTIETVDFDGLDTAELNKRKMLGPDQYLHNAIPRARAFIDRVDHAAAAAQAARLAS